jgi:hypothetical protein
MVHLLELSETLSRILPVDLIKALFINVHSCEDGIRSIFRSQNLNEGMLVAESLFTDLTVVKVPAHAALVSDASDGADAAAIACHIQVLDDGVSIDLLLLVRVFILIDWLTKFFALD